jgi:hypothetical protein
VLESLRNEVEVERENGPGKDVDVVQEIDSKDEPSVKYSIDQMDGEVRIEPKVELSNEKLLECGSVFRKPREVYESNDCFPPTISIIPAVKRLTNDTSQVQRVELFTTQNWKSYYTYEHEGLRNEVVRVKSFRDSYVWRTDETTYVKGPGIWSFSGRCLTSEEQPRVPPPVMNPLVIEEAILSSSQIWVSQISEETFLALIETDNRTRVMVTFTCSMRKSSPRGRRVPF